MVALDDLLCVDLANTWESLGLLGCGCIGVEEIDFFGSDEDKAPTSGTETTNPITAGRKPAPMSSRRSVMMTRV